MAVGRRTDSNPSMPRNNARSASASLLKISAYTPLITSACLAYPTGRLLLRLVQSLRPLRRQKPAPGLVRWSAVPVLLILLLFSAIALILLVPAVKGMITRTVVVPSHERS